MDLVVDTSVIIAVITNQPEKQILVAKTRGFELASPRSLYWEIGNAFSAMLKRGRVTFDQAKTALAIYRQIPINLLDVDLKQSLELSNRLKIYAYDS